MGFSQKCGFDLVRLSFQLQKSMLYVVIIALAASKNLRLRQMDVKNAFLHGEIDKEIYMEQPHAFEDKLKPKYVIKLRKRTIWLEMGITSTV